MELERLDIDLTDKNFEFSNAEGGGNVDPDLILGAVTATAGLAGSLLGNKTELEKQIKATCGSKPWFNGKGQKDEWRECRADFIKTQQELERARINAMNQPSTPQGAQRKGFYPPYPQEDKKGLSTGAWVGIGLGVLALGATVYIIATRNK